EGGGREIQIPRGGGTPPLKLKWRAGKGLEEKYHCEALVCVWNVGNDTIDHYAGARHKRLLHETYVRIIKDPHAQMLIGRDDVDHIHEPLLRTGRSSTSPCNRINSSRCSNTAPASSRRRCMG